MTKLSNNSGSEPPSWWEREIVKRSSDVVSNLVETMTSESSHFLQTEKPSQKPIEISRDHVKVGKMLGYGSFSTVYEVAGFDFSGDKTENDEYKTSVLSALDQQARSGNGLAIKFLRHDLIKNAENFQDAAADLIMEAKYLSALDHPNILKIRALSRGGVSAYGSGSYDGFFIVTDRLKGTLKDKILELQFLDQESSGILYASDYSLSKSILLEKIDIAHQVAKALTYLHERRLVYRDLKPQNIGFQEEKTIQLFDFGFCRELPEDGCYSEQGEPEEENKLYYMSGKGSLMYLAPEVLKSGRYNQKADVYSWSMVFYELLTLNKPYSSLVSTEAHRELVATKGIRPQLEHTNIPMPLQRLLRETWEANISRRLTMRQVCQRLENLRSKLENENNSPSDVHIAQSPAHVFCGAFWDFVFEFVSDVQCGYKVLKKATAIPQTKLGLQDDSDNSLLRVAPSKMQSISSHSENLPETLTEETWDSSIYSTTSLYLNSVEECKEMDVCEARSATVQRDDPVHEEQRVDDEREASVHVELRCPASPLARTTSAPQQRRPSYAAKAIPNNVQWPSSMEVPV